MGENGEREGSGSHAQNVEPNRRARNSREDSGSEKSLSVYLDLRFSCCARTSLTAVVLDA